MIDPQAGFWILPTRGRVATKLPRFLKAAIAMGVSTPGVIVVNETDYAENHEAYDALTLPENWTVAVTAHDLAGPKTNWALEEWRTPDTQWVGWLADDLVPETPEWDTRTLASLNGWNFVTTNDGLHAPKMANGAMAWSIALVDAVGWLFFPVVDHMYSDNAWMAISVQTQCWTCDLSVMVRHVHYSLSNSPDATADKSNEAWEHDTRAWEAWQRDDLHDTVERVLHMMQEQGVQMTKPELDGISVMIATPCGSGRYEGKFVDSLIPTMELLRAYGALVHWVKLPLMSDLVLARNKLFGAFLNSVDTHMLWIDDDMGWKPQDVVRLLLAKKDFVAAAGPRKVFPPSFAVNMSDDYGRPVGVYQDASEGLIDVTAVGMAFTLITRDCATRVAQMNVDLAFEGPDGHTEYGVFNPIIFNRRYLAEDFAFCHRWKQLGGKVYVAPHISLDHCGSYVWSGSWLELLQSEALKEQAAA